MPKVVLADTTPAIVTDHKFAPKKEWFSLCKQCNLAESAHAETVLHRGEADPGAFADK